MADRAGDVAGKVAGAWVAAVLLAMPLMVLGVCGILPTPFYDCDCAFAVLVAVWLLQQSERGWGWGFGAGVAVVLHAVREAECWVAVVAGDDCRSFAGAGL